MMRTPLLAGMVVVGLMAGHQALGQRGDAPPRGDGPPRTDGLPRTDGPSRPAGQPRGDGQQRRDGGVPQELAAAAAELKLTPEQQAAIAEKTRLMQSALAQWDQQNQDKIAQARNEATAAAPAGGRDGAGGRNSEAVHALAAERTKIESDFRAQIMAILTPEQKTAYAGMKALQDPEFQALLKALQPPAELESQLKDKTRAYGAALAEWDAQNGEAVRKVEEQMRELQAQSHGLREARDKLTADYRAAMLALLTPEQKTALVVSRMQEQILGRFSRQQLSDEQTAKVRAICQGVIKETGLNADSAPGELDVARLKAYNAVREQVLTEAQRSQAGDARQ